VTRSRIEARFPCRWLGWRPQESRSEPCREGKGPSPVPACVARRSPQPTSQWPTDAPIVGAGVLARPGRGRRRPACISMSAAPSTWARQRRAHAGMVPGAGYPCADRRARRKLAPVLVRLSAGECYGAAARGQEGGPAPMADAGLQRSPEASRSRDWRAAPLQAWNCGHARGGRCRHEWLTLCRVATLAREEARRISRCRGSSPPHWFAPIAWGVTAATPCQPR
jgi:hypothetical protein